VRCGCADLPCSSGSRHWRSSRQWHPAVDSSAPFRGGVLTGYDQTRGSQSLTPGYTPWLLRSRLGDAGITYERFGMSPALPPDQGYVPLAKPDPCTSFPETSF
jgi:hypothetical protein